MHSKSANTEIMINDEQDEVIKEHFDSLKNRYQHNLESMKGSEFVFDHVYLLYYKCDKTNPNRAESYIDSPDWKKKINKKATINPINKKDNTCFQFSVTVALNQGEIKNDTQKIIEIKPFINKHNLEGMSFPSEKYDKKTFEKNNVSIAVKGFCQKRKNISCLCLKHNSNHEKQDVLLMITNGEG